MEEKKLIGHVFDVKNEFELQNTSFWEKYWGDVCHLHQPILTP
jgi:hypothetical protein